jgi:hypothetical protein
MNYATASRTPTMTYSVLPVWYAAGSTDLVDPPPTAKTATVGNIVHQPGRTGTRNAVSGR